jgi:hypothetical protein
MFDKFVKNKKKSQKKAVDFQDKMRLELIKFQIEKKMIIKPIIRPLADRIQASIALVEAGEQELKALELALAEQENK